MSTPEQNRTPGGMTTDPVMRTPPKLPRPEPAPLAQSPAIMALRDRIADAIDAGVDDAGRAVIVERFWTQTAALTPLLERAPATATRAGTGTADEHTAGAELVVTFLWRDADAEDVLLFINRLTDERNLPDSFMRRVPGTDVWHLSYRMATDWRASYAFLPHYPGPKAPWIGEHDQVAIRASLDHGRPDPRNPHTNRNQAGTVQSVVALPDAPSQSWLAERIGTARGELSRERGPDERTVWVYQPPAAARGVGPLPVLVAFDGDIWTSSQNLAVTLDNLIADGEIPPLYALLLDAGDRASRWAQLGEDGGADSYLAERLLPWARDRYPVTDDPARVIVAGQSLGALAALWAAVRHPEVVGCVLSQSASLWQAGLLGAVSANPPASLRVYLEVGRQEWILLDPNRSLARRLTDTGAQLRYVEFNGGHDYACWRGGIADGLGWITANWTAHAG